MAHKILRLPEVIQKTGLSRSSIYLRINNGEFPKSISLGGRGRAVGWVESDIDNWVADCIERSQGDDGNA
ncbi:AlpA family transcriptional regulator [Thalassotalea sp. PS06]|uniref:AlpA family transcriptional regulator n=1 Tax=Thalassotalea sp. PS06 TaxID=2594005 RepID=UPI00116266B9|nr:AlpA family transcriptional regulator [Thalassotalea sp. PS06]QDP01567.1 AlpA family transcriptional regulator [Thalassotalea sp. PS06]